MRIAVLLSTFNGQRWLQPQLDSVLGQSHTDLVVRVRDDGSTDQTHVILDSYTRDHANFSWFGGHNLGAAQSFLSLLPELDESTSYAAYCDQDDVWEPQHLERAVAMLGSRRAAMPALWCSNVLVCDADLRPLRRHDVVRRGPSFANALVENVAPGSTIVLNRSAIELLAGVAPVAPVMHDAWCYLVVAAMGEVIYDPVPSVRYRLHGANSVGLSAGVATMAARLRRLRSGTHVGAWSRQAADLQRLYGDRLPPAHARELQRFLSGQLGVPPRIDYALTGRAHRQRPLGTVAMRVAYLAGRL